MKRVQKYSRRLGAGDLYPLFACMLTARSWESVNRGIDQSPVSASEVGPLCPFLSLSFLLLGYLMLQGCWATPGSSVAKFLLIAELEKARTLPAMCFIVAELNFLDTPVMGCLNFV